MTNLAKFALSGGLNQTWDAFFDPSSLTYTNKTRGLSYEIKPGDDAVIAEVEVPGCSPSDVKVTCEGRAIQVETPRGNAYFTVGARIDMDNIEASIQHGLLRLRVPKREAKKVEIKVLEQES